MMSRDSETWMWAQACEMVERAERLHRQFFRLGQPRARCPTWEPPVDIFEIEGELWILIALPGVQPEQIKIVVDTSALIVVGERPIAVGARAIIHRLEIPHGQFERRIDLPPGRFELVRRDVANGCLLISLRKLR